MLDFVRACLVVSSVLLSIHIKHIQGAMVIPLTSLLDYSKGLFLVAIGHVLNVVGVVEGIFGY